jgi:uncharacterized membrane protein
MASAATREQNNIISGKTIGSLVLGALVSGLVAGAFGYARLANSDHFALSTLDRAFTALSAEIPATYVRQDVYSADVRAFRDELNEAERRDEEIIKGNKEILHLLLTGKK